MVQVSEYSAHGQSDKILKNGLIRNWCRCGLNVKDTCATKAGVVGTDDKDKDVTREYFGTAVINDVISIVL